MLCNRVIPVIQYYQGRTVKTLQFDEIRMFSSPVSAARIYNRQDVDELIFLDIRAYVEGRKPEFDLIGDIIDSCFMPVSVGGGVRSLQDIRDLLSVGADKVVLNSFALKRPEIIAEASEKFGSQCIVVSIDAKREDDGTYRIYGESGSKPYDIGVVAWAQKVQQLGAGEILINSIERDGMLNGLEIPLVRQVTGNVSLPVIASGGIGKLEHLVEGIHDGGASAVAAGSLFLYTEVSPMAAKSHMAQQGVLMREQLT